MFPSVSLYLTDIKERGGSPKARFLHRVPLPKTRKTMKFIDDNWNCCSLCGENLMPHEIDICDYCDYGADDDKPIEVDKEEE